MKSKIASKCRNLGLTWILIVVVLITSFCLVVSVSAGTWRDDFEDDNFDGWRRNITVSTWTVLDGFLQIQMNTRDPTADFLEFIASPGPYRQFTVTLTNPSIGMRIGLAKAFPGPVEGRQDFYFYSFSAYEISALNVNRFGGTFVSGFRNWLPRNPGTIWRDAVVNLKVNFDAGRFQYFADEALRADFEDSHFDQIDFITIMIVGGGAIHLEQVDAFEVSGPGIGVQAVQSKGKLASSWGGMKNHSLR